MVHVIASIELYTGQREAFLEAFRKLVPQVLAEAGCIEYGPTIDVATGLAAQLPVRENVVTIVEKWASLDHLKAHLSAAHMAAYREEVQELVAGMTLVVTTPV